MDDSVEVSDSEVKAEMNDSAVIAALVVGCGALEVEVKTD